MRLTPSSSIAKIVAIFWLAACCALLVFAYVQREVHDMPEGFTWLLVMLTFPVGLPVGAIVGITMSSLYKTFGLPYSPFFDLLPSWIVMVTFGYWQWFLLPSILRRRWQDWRNL
jgi:hypothetical protein